MPSPRPRWLLPATIATLFACTTNDSTGQATPVTSTIVTASGGEPSVAMPAQSTSPEGSGGAPAVSGSGGSTGFGEGGTAPLAASGTAGQGPESAPSVPPAQEPEPAPPEEPAIEPCAPLTDEFFAYDVCPTGPFDELPLIEDEEEQLLCTDEVNWAEGPLWSTDDGTLYFSNFDEEDHDTYYDGSIMTWREAEGCVDLLPNVGTNGLALGPRGTFIAGRHTNRTLSRVDPTTGAVCSLADNFEGKRFSSPNDVAVRADGNIYFTDPAWNVGERTEELPQSLYRIDAEGTLSVVDVFDEQRPNGVNFSPDGSLLYLAIVGAILVYDVDESGLVSNRREFVSGPNVDGMALDCAGNVYASTGYVYSPDGEMIGDFWGGSNLAFGGPDGKTLFITGHGRLTSLRVNIPGMPY